MDFEIGTVLESFLHHAKRTAAQTVLVLVSFASVHARAELTTDFTSALDNEPSRWVLVAGTAATLLVLATPSVISGPLEKSAREDRPLGEYSKYGDLMGQMIPNALYAGGMALTGYFGGSSAAMANAEMMFMASGYAAIVSTALKYTIREGRPYDSNERNSFPSGHTTTAFAFAGIIAAQHGWWYGVPAMAMASFVGYSRINDHKHYLKDVVAGATVGLSCALGIYFARQDAAESPNTLNIVPQPLPGGLQLALNWNF